MEFNSGFKGLMKNVSKVTALFHQISFHTQPKPLKIIHCAQCICFIFGHSSFHYRPGHCNYIAEKLCIHCDVPQLLCSDQWKIKPCTL